MQEVRTQTSPGKPIHVPGTSEREAKRKRKQTPDPETYFRTRIYEPLLRDLQDQLQFRSSKQTKKSMLLSKLVPGLSSFEDGGEEFFFEALEMYRTLLPPHTQMSAAGELKMWRNMWAGKPRSQRPVTYIDAFRRCPKNCFPLTWSLLRIGATQPVTTASVERSFSTLKRVKTWLRNRMGETRLSALAMMAIHPEHIPSPETVLHHFMLQKRRRIH